jgi:hypothetical protein
MYRRDFVNIVGEKTSFVDRITRILERVQYRRAENREDKAAIFRMRHEAYTRNGSIETRPSGMFHDAFDETPNAWLIGVFIDGELASSIRIHVSAALDQPLPATMWFSDVVSPHLQAGRCIIDASRHVNRWEFSREFPEMPYITMRPGFLAEEYFDADYLTGACRAENQGAFRRMFGVVCWAPPREYSHLTGLWALMAYDCHALRAKTLQRYPFYFSSAAEQQALFWKSSSSFEYSRRTIRQESVNS